MKKIFTVLLGISLCLSVASCGKNSGAGNANKAEIEEIVKNYILEHPEILIQSVQNGQQKAEAEANEKAEAEVKNKQEDLYRNPHSPVYGNEKGSIQLVEFFDYNCGYCKRMIPDITKLVSENKDVKVIFKELPILGPTSETAAKAALAVHDIAPGKYFAFHAALMEHNGPKDEAAIKEAAGKAGIDGAKIISQMKDEKYNTVLAQNVELAKSLGISATPTFILNDKIVRGAVSYGALKEISEGKDVDKARQDNPPR